MSATVKNGLMALVLAGCSFWAWRNEQDLKDTFAYESSPIEWCEENYVHHPLIAEFWNSTSSLALIAVGLVAKLFVAKNVSEKEPNLYLVWLLMALVGSGSVLFHATLSVAGQVFDELPISLLCLFGGFMLRPLHKWDMNIRDVVFTWQFLLSLVATAGIGSLLQPIVSHVLCLMFCPVTTYSFIVEYIEASEVAQRQAKRIFFITIFFFILAVASWLTDRLVCTEVQSFLGWNPQLHAWWHVFMSFTFLSAVITGIILRTHGDGYKVKLVDSAIPMLPYVTLSKVL